MAHLLVGDSLDPFFRSADRVLGEYLPFGPEVWVHRTAHVAPTASITGPCIIGPEAEVRHCAIIRGSAVVRQLPRTERGKLDRSALPSWR